MSNTLPLQLVIKRTKLSMKLTILYTKTCFTTTKSNKTKKKAIYIADYTHGLPTRGREAQKQTN